MKHEESKIQELVVRYLRVAYPTALFCASSGGARMSMKQALVMKRTGYVRGFPDLAIYEPRNGKHGLFLEIKTEKGVASEFQKDWQTNLIARGYEAKICKGFEATIKVIDEYFRS
jgi:hypothetical protein